MTSKPKENALWPTQIALKADPGTSMLSKRFRNGELPWAAACVKVTDNPWTGVLPRRFVELVGVALNAA